MMEIKTLAELTTPDPLTLRFTPSGFSMGGTMKPESSAQFQQQSIAAYDLHSSVAENTRKSFERLRILHSHGVLFYEAFAIAADLSWLVMEQSFRECFVAHYDGVIPFKSSSGEEDRLSVQNFDEVYEAVNRGKFRTNSWNLVIKSTNETMKFRGNLTHLQTWARKEGLLHGQRNRGMERIQRDKRNSVAHANYQVTTPFVSARAISDLSEIINRLWGHSTPGGRLYPAPLTREVLVVAWDDSQDGSNLTQFRGDQLVGCLTEFDDGKNWTFLVIRGVFDDDQMEFDAQFERTKFPSELLWGPGKKEDALAWLQTDQPAGDTVQYLDRLFAFRINDGKVSLPRRPEVALALPLGYQAGRWLLIQADFPNDAFAHARHIKDGKLCEKVESIPVCDVQDIFDGGWQGMVDKLSAEYKLAEPTELSRARVPPRWQSAADVETE